MKIFNHCIIMLIIFSVLFTLTTIGLELIEGYKITTTSYYGLKNIGFSFIFYIYMFCLIVYFFTFFPIILIINKYIRSKLVIRMFVYSLFAVLSGIWAFNELYGHANGSFITGYELNINSAIILYGLAGLMYSILDYYFDRKTC